MKNIPSYETFVGESYEAIRKAMRKAGVQGSSKEDTHGTTVTFRSDEDRDAAARAIEAAGLSAKPVDGHALRVTEAVNEASAATIAVASDISDYQKNMSRETFDKLVDRVAANLDLHDKSKRKLLADHLANSLPRPDDDLLSKKEIAGLADEIVYGKWMGESQVAEAAKGKVVATDVVQGARFRLRNGLVVSVLDVDPDGYLKTSNAQKQQPDDRTAVTSHIGGSGDRAGRPFKDSLRDFLSFLSDEGGAVLESRVDEYGAPTKHRDRLDRVRVAAEKAVGPHTWVAALRKDWSDMETRIAHSPSSLVDRELDDFMRDVLSRYDLDLADLDV